MPRVSAPPIATAAPATITATAAAPTTTAVAATGFAVPPGVPPPLMGSSDPTKMVSAGLANNFNGRVESLWLLPRLVEKTIRGKGKLRVYELFAQLNIRCDDTGLGHEGLVTEYLKVDQLSQWVPSRTDPTWDGSKWIYTPAGDVGGQPASVDTYMILHSGQNGFPSAEIDPATNAPKWAMLPPESWFGWYAVPGKQNSRTGFMKGTKWEHFTTELEKSGYKAKAPHVNWLDFRQLLVGVYAHWVRLEYKFKGGAGPVDRQEGDRELTTLCVGELLDLGPISGAGGSLSATSAAVPAPSPVVAPPMAAAPAATAAPAPLAGPAPVSVSAPAPGPAPASMSTGDAVSAATNEIVTEAVKARGAAGITRGEAANLVYAQINARGLDAGQALRYMNDLTGWMVGDSRGFGFVPERDLIVPLG